MIRVRHPGALLLASAPLAAIAPLALRFGWAGPLIAGSCAWVFLLVAHEEPRRRVVGTLLAWAALLSLSQVTLTYVAPETAAWAIPNGPRYWDEMRPWLLTGIGKESSPALFIPEHLAHLLGFCALALVSAGWGGLVLGAYLLGYMSYYVGHVALSAESPVLAAALGWHPWAVLRVAAFVLIGVSLAKILIVRAGWRVWLAAEWRWLTAGGVLFVADIVLKAFLGPHWWRVILRLAGAS